MLVDGRDKRNMKIQNTISEFLVMLVRTYQKVASERIRGSCRFSPTCSNYAISAIEKYGAHRGVLLAIKRLARCRPPHGGIDPVN